VDVHRVVHAEVLVKTADLLELVRAEVERSNLEVLRCMLSQPFAIRYSCTYGEQTLVLVALRDDSNVALRRPAEIFEFRLAHLECCGHSPAKEDLSRACAA
jgi:hypothetical protein